MGNNSLGKGLVRRTCPRSMGGKQLQVIETQRHGFFYWKVMIWRRQLVQSQCCSSKLSKKGNRATGSPLRVKKDLWIMESAPQAPHHLLASWHHHSFHAEIPDAMAHHSEHSRIPPRVRHTSVGLHLNANQTIWDQQGHPNKTKKR